MRLVISATIALLGTAPATGQVRCAAALIPTEASREVPGVPHDGLWSSQYYLGEGDEFLRPVDGVWLGTVEHDFIRWQDEQRTYRGFGGHEWRALPLDARRFILERDHGAGHGTWVQVVEWSGEDLHVFQRQADLSSPFARRLKSAGIDVSIDRDGRGLFGEEVQELMLSGPREAVLDALRSLPLDERPNERYRRPSHEEMSFIWSWFEVERFVDQQREVQLGLRRELPRAQRLNELHRARFLALPPALARLEELGVWEDDPFEYSRLYEGTFDELAERTETLLADIGVRLEQRMAWLAEQIEVIESIEPVRDPENPFDSVHYPSPGSSLSFHVKIENAAGDVVEDTWARDEPATAALMGDMPEGLQWALRSVGFGGRLTVRIPAALAFGSQLGDVTVELAPLEYLRLDRELPSIVRGVPDRLGPVAAADSPSGLRHRVVREGIGGSPGRGQDARIRWMSWDAAGRPVEAEREDNIVLGGEGLMAGMTEALLSMKSGEQRVLFVPRHLAETRRDRSGMAQCVVVELIGFRE